MQLGIDRCIDSPPDVLASGSFGLLMNQASVTHDLELSCDAMARTFGSRFKAIFSPQHGIWGEQQANMIESRDSVYGPLGLPVYSLYSQTRVPTPEMLSEIDCLVIDLQDVGTRVYTFVWTMLECLRACAEHGKVVVILDRPNPLGGEVFEGPMLEAAYVSFVGGAQIPLRHGLTMAELARLLVHEFALDVDLRCVPVTNWKRPQLFSDTGRPWLWPSPNMPTVATALLYPGQVLLEGTNLSEGRGTTRPFEVTGAAFIDPFELEAALSQYSHPGLRIQSMRFQPTFDKWAGESCGGIEFQVRNASQVRSVASTVALLCSVASLYGAQFAWLPPPYEYDYRNMPIDILFGTASLRLLVEQARTRPVGQHEIDAICDLDTTLWLDRIRPFLLYS